MKEKSDDKYKSAYFFCYILPVIIVSVILAPTIIGLIIFCIIMYRGKDEFAKGRERCIEGNFSVDWDFTEYKYSSNGNIESGIKDLDLFLIILKPLFNLLFCTMWKAIDMISAFVLKIIFSISCLIYRGFHKKIENNQQQSYQEYDKNKEKSDIWICKFCGAENYDNWNNCCKCSKSKFELTENK